MGREKIKAGSSWKRRTNQDAALILGLFTEMSSGCGILIP